MNRKFMLSAVLVFLSAAAWAGDTAVFVDLGFSADGKNYMFGQYGINESGLQPWAELYMVDVAANDFVSGGKMTYTHDRPVRAGHDGSGALYQLLSRAAPLANRYRIDFLLQGQLVYVSMENGSAAAGGETIEFRDFEKVNSFRAALKISGSQNTGAAFSIAVDRRNRDGSMRSYTAGNPELRRPGVVSYRIRRVLSSPQGNALIFVVEMKKFNSDGSTTLRYMIETLPL